MSSSNQSKGNLGKNGTGIAILLLRLSLAIGLLSAVADRFGIWGPPGTPLVAWGTFANFLTYTAKLNPWFPSSLIPAVGWSVTVAETMIGFALIVGYQLRLVAISAAILTLSFGLAMAFTLGVQAPLNYSVFIAATGSYLLSQVADNSPLILNRK